MYVPRDGSRDILLRFQVPQSPDARAGRYPFVVEIQTEIIGIGDSASRRNPAMQLRAFAVGRRRSVTCQVLLTLQTCDILSVNATCQVLSWPKSGVRADRFQCEDTSCSQK